MKRFVAYTSIAHFGFIALGIFAFSTQAFAGATLYMVNHGISTGMLFIVVGMLIARGGSRLIGDYGGVHKLAPLLAGHVPARRARPRWRCPAPTRSSASSWCWSARTRASRCYTILATVGIIFAALYVLWVYQRIDAGPGARRRGARRSGAGGRAGHHARPGRRGRSVTAPASPT